MNPEMCMHTRYLATVFILFFLFSCILSAPFFFWSLFSCWTESFFFLIRVCVRVFLYTMFRSLLCNKSSICWFVMVRFICAETGRKLLWFVTNSMEMPSTMLSHFDMRWLRARCGGKARGVWHSFLMNISGTWILWLQPCQRQQKHFTAQENCFLCYTHAHTRTQWLFLSPRTTSNLLRNIRHLIRAAFFFALQNKSNKNIHFIYTKQFDMIRLQILLYWSWTCDVIDRIGRKLADYIPVSREPCSAKSICAKRCKLQ